MTEKEREQIERAKADLAFVKMRYALSVLIEGTREFPNLQHKPRWRELVSEFLKNSGCAPDNVERCVRAVFTLARRPLH